MSNQILKWSQKRSNEESKKTLNRISKSGKIAIVEYSYWRDACFNQNETRNTTKNLRFSLILISLVKLNDINGAH